MTYQLSSPINIVIGGIFNGFLRSFFSMPSQVQVVFLGRTPRWGVMRPSGVNPAWRTLENWLHWVSEQKKVLGGCVKMREVLLILNIRYQMISDV